MLALLHVSRSFGTVSAVRDVSLTIPSGATYALLGPNGAGKTTTMRMILGILIPDRGSVTWRDRPIDALTRRRFGYLPEERGLYGKMNVRDQIVYFARLHGLSERNAVVQAERWMERLGVADFARRPCAELSKGNQQKVQVACAVVHEPEFIILDEPFSGLDPLNAEVLLAVLRDVQRAGATLVLSSHHMGQIEDLCTHVCIIANGSVRANGSLNELRQAWPTRVVVVEPASEPLARVMRAQAGGAERLMHNGTLAFDVPRDIDLPDLARRLVAAGDLTRFERLQPSLRDIYVHAIGETR